MANVLNEICCVFSGVIQLNLFLFFPCKITPYLREPGYRKTWRKKWNIPNNRLAWRFCGSTYGTYSLPNVSLQSSTFFNNWVEGEPHCTMYDCTTSGWFDLNTFEKLFLKIFLPNASALHVPYQWL